MRVTVRKGNNIHVIDGATSVGIEGDSKSGVAQRSEQAPYKSPTMGSTPTARTKSTAARKDVPRGPRSDLRPPAPPDQRGGNTNEEAGTQAPPVDTPKRGRPRLHPDAAAKQREYRARKKEKK